MTHTLSTILDMLRRLRTSTSSSASVSDLAPSTTGYRIQLGRPPTSSCPTSSSASISDHSPIHNGLSQLGPAPTSTSSSASVFVQPGLAPSSCSTSSRCSRLDDNEQTPVSPHRHSGHHTQRTHAPASRLHPSPSGCNDGGVSDGHSSDIPGRMLPR